jgi:hypothetical protein
MYSSTPYTDDFCMDYIRHIDKDVFSIIKERYIVKEGRFVSLPGLFQIVGFKYLSFKVMSMIWVAFFAAMTFVLSKLYINESIQDNKLGYLLVLMLFLVGSEKVLNDVVFWATGGSYYSVASFLMIFALLIIAKQDKRWFLYLSPLFITIGPNYSLPILFLYLFELIDSKNIEFKKKIFFSVLSIFVFAIGIYILLNSPGTQSRLNTVSTFWMWHPRYIIEAVSNIIYTAFYFYPTSIIFAIFGIVKACINYFKSKERSVVKFFRFIFELRFLIAAIGSVLVFVKTPGLFSERAAYAFFILVLLQFIYSSRDFVFTKKMFILLKGASLLLLLTLSYTLINVIRFNNDYNNEIGNYKNRKASFEERYLYNTVNLPFKRFRKVEKTNNQWIGDCFDNYYIKNYDNK